MRRLLIACGIVAASASVFAQAPEGDYGDAPDGGREAYAGEVPVVGRFPTLFSSNGVRHPRTTSAWLGAADSVTSRETDATDTADPDGTPNLPAESSNADGADDGLLRTFKVTMPGPTINAATQPPPERLFGVVAVSTAPGDGARTLYLNALVDLNRNGEWRGVGGATEWSLRNLRIEQPAGTTREYLVPIGERMMEGPMWARITLTEEPIDRERWYLRGGWNGQGEFAAGETEDYFLGDDAFTGPVSPPNNECILVGGCLGPVKLPHGVDGSVAFGVALIGGDECDYSADWDLASPFATAVGLGVPRGPVADIGQVAFFTPETTDPSLPGVYQSRFVVSVTSTLDPPERTEGQIVTASFSVTGGDGVKRFAFEDWCPCMFVHDGDDLVEDPIPIPGPPGPHPVGSNRLRFFSSVKPSHEGGVFRVAMRDSMFPAIPPRLKGVIPRYWVLDYEPGSIFSVDEIPNIFFQWQDLFAGGAPNGITDPTKLVAARWDGNQARRPLDFTAFGDQVSIVTQGGTNVAFPGFFGGIIVVGEDLNDNGLPDFSERVKGDINSDGVVDMSDFLAFRRDFGPERRYVKALDPIAELNADVNEDGAVDTTDGLALLAMVLDQ